MPSRKSVPAAWLDQRLVKESFNVAGGFLFMARGEYVEIQALTSASSEVSVGERPPPSGSAMSLFSKGASANDFGYEGLFSCFNTIEVSYDAACESCSQNSVNRVTDPAA